MISGRQALAHIEQTIEKMRRQEAQLEQDYAAATEEVGRLRLQLTESFRELARLKMDARAGTGRRPAGCRRTPGPQPAQQPPRPCGSSPSAADRRRSACGRPRRRQTAVDALEKILEQVETIRRNVEAKVSIDAEWITARAQVNQVTGQAQQAEKKAVQAEADRDEKRRPYEEDQLFMYLWNRKFGTAEYRADHFTRTMDRLVARVVGYDKARANYALLNEIPERLREHSRRILHQLREEREKLTALERKALVEAGIEAAEEAAKARGRAGQRAAWARRGAGVPCHAGPHLRRLGPGGRRPVPRGRRAAGGGR